MDLFLDIVGLAYSVVLLQTLSDLGKPYPKIRHIHRKNDLVTMALALAMLIWVLVIKWGGVR